MSLMRLVSVENHHCGWKWPLLPTRHHQPAVASAQVLIPPNTVAKAVKFNKRLRIKRHVDQMEKPFHS